MPGCTVVLSRKGGPLAYRLRDEGKRRLPGGKPVVQVSTSYSDTPKHRALLGRRAAAMADELKVGTFNWVRWFPSKVTTADQLVVEAITIGDYVMDTWLPSRQPPLVRRSLALTSAKVWKRYLKPQWAPFELAEITTGGLLRFRDELLAKGLKLKTVRNIIGGIFQAIVRDAIKAGVVEYMKGNPFDGLKGTWPRREKLRIDPFTIEERDEVLDYFRTKRQHWHSFVLTAFATGMRPSELCALRLGDVDLRHGTVEVLRSRTMHEDHAPKTPASERVVRLPSTVVAVLRDRWPLHVDPDAFVFVQPSGQPVHGESFQKNEWRRALGALKGKVKARKFYACRHTCASVLLSKGTPVKFVAEQLGTSLAMLQMHYGKFMGGDARQLDAALGLPVVTIRRSA